MTKPLEAADKNKNETADRVETPSNAAAKEAVAALEVTPKIKPDATVAARYLPDGKALLEQLAESASTKGPSSETIKRDNGYSVTAERDSKGLISRIAESDGTVWTRSPDGKSMVLNGSGEKVAVKDIKVDKDGAYTFVLPDGQQVKRNADRSVSTFDDKGHERIRANSDGSQLLFDDKHRVTASVDAAGVRRGYGYSSDGKLDAVVDPDGSLWLSTNGRDWKKQGANQARSGELTIAQDGSQTVKNARGETTTFKIDGSAVTADIEGRVSSVKLKDGSEKRFEYDAQGKLNAIKDSAGESLTTKDGRNWTKAGADRAVPLEISVDRDGTVHEKRQNGVEVAKRTDGWNEVKQGNSSHLERTYDDGSVVVKNALGQVTETRDSHGKVRKFEYDSQGTINKINDAGVVSSSRDGLHWTNEKTKESWTGRVDVVDEGLIRRVSENGSKVVYKPDGSQINVDASNRITRVEDANHAWRNFEYGTDGKLSVVSDSKGGRISTTDGTTWTRPGSSANLNLSVSLRPDGTYEEKDLATGSRKLSLTDGRGLTIDKDMRIVAASSQDGSKIRYDYGENGQPKGFELTNKDNGQVTFDAQGRVVTTKSIDGQTREFKYGANGKMSEIKEPDGKTWSSIDGDNWTSNKGEKWKGNVWVSSDGNYSYVENNAVVTKQLDGNTLYREQSGATRLENKDQQIIETVDAKGVKRTYERNTSGEIVKQTEGADTWVTTDGTNWRNLTNGAPWQGKVRLDKDGTYYHEDSAGNRQWRKPDGSRQDVNYKAMEVAADAIEYACNGGTGIGTDEKTIYATLENKTLAERQLITEIWNKKYGKIYGHTLEAEFQDEMKGSDLEKANSLLKRPDGSDDAGTIRVALTERSEWTGRSSGELEKVVRNTLETMSAADIAKTDAEYRRRYGQSLSDAIKNDTNLSADTKAAAAIYLKGADQRTAEDTKMLAVRAATSGNAEMFQESMRRAPKEVRDYFASGEGQKLMKENFEGHWYHALTFGLTGNVTDTEFRHVQDYAEHGKLSVGSQVSDNTSWLGDNEQAIEHSLEAMSDSERQSYALGRKIARNETVDQSVTEEQKKRALDYYTKTSEALKTAAGHWFSGDSQINELAKWEDMIAQKGGSIVARLADHRGSIYDSSMHDVIDTVETMTKEDWQRLKSDPGQRDKIDTVLKTYLSDDERKRTMEIIDGKIKAESFEASQQNRRPLLDAIEDNRRWYNNDESQMYRAIENMTDKERELYRKGSDSASTDVEAKNFVAALDARLKDSLDSSEQKVAFGLLEQVKRGEKPEMSVVQKLNVHASNTFSDDAQVIRDIEQAFVKDPTLRERINNPKTDTDRAYAAEFKDAAGRALGRSDYEKYAKPLIETGQLSAELRLDLSRGLFNDDEQGAYRDLQRVSDSDKQRILSDRAFQDRVLGFLSADERQVALASMQQGELRPEDKLRSYQLGLGTSEDEIKATLGQLNDRSQLRQEGKSEQEIDSIIQGRLQNLRTEYARKYGSDLSADLVSELGGKDQRQAMRQVAGRDARGEFLYSLNEAAETRSGIGSAFVDRAWDGTGYQLDNEINQLAKSMVEDPAKVRDHVSNVYKLVDMHSASKEALADAVVDTTVAAVAVGGAFFTGGVSLSLLAYTGAGAAVFKVGTKAVLMGGDYDAGSSQVWLDGATGFADGFTTFLGASAAKSAAQKVLTTGGKSLLKEGSEKTLQEGAEQLVKQGLTQGGKITDEAISSLAKQIAKEGDEKAVTALLKKSLGEAVEEQSRTMLKQIVLSTPANTLAGMAGSGLSGSIRAGAEAKDFEQFLKSAGTSTAFGAFGGAAGAFVLAPGFVAASKSWSAIRSSLPRELNAINLTAALATHSSVGLPEGHLVQPHFEPQTVTMLANDAVPPARPVDNPVVLRSGADVGDALPTKFEPSRISQFSAEIERKFVDAPISLEQFKTTFAGMSDADRKLALEFLEQSAPNMHSRKLDLQMEALTKKINEMPGLKEDPLKVFVLSGDTSGNALAHILKKNAGHTKVDIVELDAAALKAMAENGKVPKNALIFDDLAQATPAQKEALAKVQNLIVADLGGFNKGLNLYDFGASKFAGPELVQAKLQGLIAEARKLPGAENLTDQELARRVLQGDVRARAAEFNSNASVYDSPMVETGGRRLRAAASEGQPDAISERHQIESLYQEFTSPLVTREQIHSFLGGMDAERQAVAAHILRDGLQYQSYSTMMGQMRDLHEMVLKELPAGKTAKDILIVTGIENNGSEYLVNHLYAKVNGLTKDNYITLADLRSRGPGAADGKVVVYIDDYSYSGRQAAGVVNSNAQVLKDSGGKVVVGTLGRYQTDTNPWDLHLTDSRYAGLGTVNPTALSPNQYLGFYQFVQQPNNPMSTLFSLEQIERVAGKKTALKGSVVSANLLMPYGGPNNNLKFISEFARRVGLPGR
ncbi:MAG: hypothetical protein C0473_03610 [Cyanobacteria bacterium DS3.002]|nr:hypothetical protein [Cyanobacteria bacterium DS3.002]MBA4049934.1 hypothetical protein [Cyanobacteria bacterium DS2.008]